MCGLAANVRCCWNGRCLLEAIARIENVPVAEEVRRALAEHIAARRKDKAFQARLKASIERNAEILRRLASE